MTMRRPTLSSICLVARFQAAYPTPGEGDTITKEYLFYYIYGLLHSPDYRSRYADNLGKELPRIPAVKRFAELTPSLPPLGRAAPNAAHCRSRKLQRARHQAFSQAGRDLAHWHLNYETVPYYEGVTIERSAQRSAGTLARSLKQGGEAAKSSTKRTGVPALLSSQPSRIDALLSSPNPDHVRVEKMKFAKTRDPETNKSINDKTTVHYNAHLTIRDIPEEAYTYIVNGKPALEWVMERQSVTTDKDSGITNDANLWATETMGNPKYPRELFLRVITVSLETMKIVEGLPKLEVP